jgi:hypothetical protein
MKAIVYPIITGIDYCQPAAPIALERASKAQALAALRAAGFRIMTAGGSHDVTTITAEELRGRRGDQPEITRRERDLGHQLPDDAEIICYSIAVYP